MLLGRDESGAQGFRVFIFRALLQGFLQGWHQGLARCCEDRVASGA